MLKSSFCPAAAFFILANVFLIVPAQTAVCRKEALEALRPVPELKYGCREGVDDYDAELLKFPERQTALARYTAALENLNGEAWWNTTVNDLAACFISQKAGALSVEENQQFEDRGSVFNLHGNFRYRLVIAKDPCYQTQFGGSNFFLLVRAGSQTFATEVVDGFYSRADNPVKFAVISNGMELIFEISTTGGGMSPTITNYYFTIDQKTGQTVPKNLFKQSGKKSTNQITSVMFLEDSADYGLPPNLEPLAVFNKSRLAAHFDSFIDRGQTFGPDRHAKFDRITWRWNGKHFLSSATKR